MWCEAQYISRFSVGSFGQSDSVEATPKDGLSDTRRGSQDYNMTDIDISINVRPKHRLARNSDPHRDFISGVGVLPFSLSSAARLQGRVGEVMGSV